MVSRDEVVWLYRCVLGRPPESEDVIDWAVRNHDTFERLRRHFLDASEFREQLGCLYLPRVSIEGNCSRSEAILHDLQVATTLRTGSSEISRIPFGGLDPLLRIVGPRLRVQFAVVFGGIDELRLVIDLLMIGGVRPCVIVICKDDHALDLPATLQRQIELPPFITLVERNGSFRNLMEQIGAKEMQPELVVLGSANIDRDDLFAAYQSLYFAGLVLCDTSKDYDRLAIEVAACAEQLHLDVVNVENFVMLQKTAWFVPVSWKPLLHNRSDLITKRHSLALASIVKNEAANIESMLNSIIPVVDFVALVDTGSVDDTVERAKDLLRRAGIPHDVRSVEFVNFSQARNTALEMVPADVEWVLMLDADEHLVAEDYPRLLALLDLDVDAWMLPRYNFHDLNKIEDPSPYPDRQRRLFRNRSERPIRFNGAVHETPANVEKWGVAPANLAFLGRDVGGPHIHHMGQVALTKERWHEKNNFYGSLMK